MVNAAGNPVPRTQVAGWERGKHLPAQRYWLPLANALRIDVSQLFAGLVEETPQWVVTLTNRVDALEKQLRALARLLGLLDVVEAAPHAPSLSDEQRAEWESAAEELAAQSERSEGEGLASESREASG